MRIPLLAAFSAMALQPTALTAAAPKPSPVEDVRVVMARLGSETFAERDAAAITLERMGTAALPALAEACRSDDPEIRRRAETLVDRIKRVDVNGRLLDVNPIRLDYKNVPLGTAVNDLRNKSRINLALDPARVANPLRPITVKTEELPPWQAIDEFCKAAGLKEIFTADLQPPKPEPSRGRRGYYPQQVPTAQNAASVAVVLADGQAATLPGERSKAIRVLALPPNFSANRIVLGSGEVTINLDVAPLPGQNWQDVVGVRIHRAIDASGHRIPASHRTEPALDLNQYYDGNVVIMNGRMAMWNGDVVGQATPPPLPNPRVVPVTLRTGDTNVKLLKFLEGTVQTEVIVPNQTLMSVENVLKSAGAAFDGPEMSKLTINDVRRDEKTGRTSLRLRLESPSPWILQQQKARRVGAANVLGGMVFIDAPIAPSQGPQFQVLNADDKPLTSTSTTYSSGQTDDGMRMFSEIGLTFQAGVPAKLVMTGPRTVTVDVPFRLENVPLP